MTQVIIDDIIPRTQLIATAGQTVFNTNWTADATTDIDVYARADGVEPDDLTQLVSPSLYNVTFIGGSQTVRVTFLSGRTLDDVITIVRNTPATRTNLYINTNFVPSMLNQDFGILTLVDQQAQMYDTVVNPGYNVSATIEPDSILGGGDVILPILPAGYGWRKSMDGTHIEAILIPDGGFAPSTAPYLIKTAVAELPNAQVMGALATGLVVNTTGTGIQLTRTLTPVANQTSILNGTGIAGNPTIGIADNAIMPGHEGIGIPSGTTAQRPISPASTDFRFNTDLIILEYWDGSEWVQISETDGVVTAQGTANQVLVNGTFGTPIDGAIILTTPQDIAPTSSPTFANLTLGGASQIRGANGLPVFTILSLASAVNSLVASNQIAGSYPALTAFGSDTDVGISFVAQAAGVLTFTTTASAALQYRTGTASQHITNFIFPNTAATQNVTFQDASGTVAYLSDVAGTVTSLTGTANQLLVNATSGSPQTGALTLTLPSTLIAPGTVQVGNLLLSGNTLSSTDTNGNINIVPNGDGLTLIGEATAVTITGISPQVQFNSMVGGMLASTFRNTAGGTNLSYLKSRGTSINAHAIVQNGDILGNNYYFGDDGSTFNTLAAAIAITVSGAPSVGIIPTQMTFSTMNTSGVLTPGISISNDQRTILQNPLQLAYGGSNAVLTASNGGIVYSTASAMAILSGTATANLPLLSGSSSAPSWGAFALSLGGALTTAGAHTLSGAFASTFTFTNTTSVTFPTSGTLATTSQIPTGAALTKTDDTNVTLTLGGSPTTALVNAASLTLGWTGQLSLARGGSNANLTASNGGIIYSTASAMAVLSGTATANQLLLSGASGAPSWSTTTYPATNAINTLLYASSANVMSALATANSSVLVTSSGGVPSLSTALPSGLTATNMNLTTPTLGVASATSINFGGGALSSYVPKTSFTPTFTFATVGDLSVSYATQVGLYERIGNLVNYTIVLTCTPTFTTSAGAIRISSLPLTALTGGYSFYGNIVNDGALTYTGTSIYAQAVSNTTYIQIQTTKSATAEAALSTTALVSGVAVTFKISGSYFV